MCGRAKTRRLALLGVALTLVAFCTAAGAGDQDRGQSVISERFHFSDVPAGHRHMHELLANAFGYLDPAHGIIDPISGYPVEGWNQEPENGIFLRSFTQLTAIGAWVELLANIAAGVADNPYLSGASALSALGLAMGSLLDDQRNPELSAKGLLVNFLSLEGRERKGPLQESLTRSRFVEALGEQTADAVWRALVEKGWLQEQANGRIGKIDRSRLYGAAHFEGALAPYAEEPLRSTIMGLLDQRAVTIIFGDNANLSAALSRSVGALLRPRIRKEPRAIALRVQMERFLDRQRGGYEHLFDRSTGTFVFGWEATSDRFVGWDDGQGNWVTGQMNYLINEFRGPLMFVVLRFGFPAAWMRNAGFKIKPYRYRDGSERYVLAAWDGSAFELLGLSLFMQEDRNPGWSRSLEALADIELDFSSRNRLPGLLSEAYSGNGAEYTGQIGISDIAVIDTPLITHAPSLYSLGVAYTIAPARIESFLHEHWPRISRLFTVHGPWEGWNTSTMQVIHYQTTAHTLSLILGGLNTAQENMRLYLEERRLLGGLEALYPRGDPVDLLAAEISVRPWNSDQRPYEFSRESGDYLFSVAPTGSAGMTFGVPQEQGVSLSNGTLVIRYRSASGVPDAAVSFARVKGDPLPPPAIPVEIFVRFKPTSGDAIEVVLPATPALTGIGEVSLTFRNRGNETPLDVEISGFEFVPFPSGSE